MHRRQKSNPGFPDAGRSQQGWSRKPVKGLIPPFGGSRPCANVLALFIMVLLPLFSYKPRASCVAMAGHISSLSKASSSSFAVPSFVLDKNIAPSHPRTVSGDAVISAFITVLFSSHFDGYSDKEIGNNVYFTNVLKDAMFGGGCWPPPGEDDTLTNKAEYAGFEGHYSNGLYSLTYLKEHQTQLPGQNEYSGFRLAYTLTVSDLDAARIRNACERMGSSGALEIALRSALATQLSTLQSAAKISFSEVSTTDPVSGVKFDPPRWTGIDYVDRCRCHDISSLGVRQCFTTGGELTMCSQQCNPHTSGLSCTCHQGFFLADDDRTCLDVDECKVHNTCDPLTECQNRVGGGISCSECPPMHRGGDLSGTGVCRPSRRPGPPQKPTVFRGDVPTSAELYWTLPEDDGGEPLQAAIVSITPLPAGWHGSRKLGAGATMLHVDGLLYGETYRFLVWYENDVDEGLSSEPSEPFIVDVPSSSTSVEEANLEIIRLSAAIEQQRSRRDGPVDETILRELEVQKTHYEKQLKEAHRRSSAALTAKGADWEQLDILPGVVVHRDRRESDKMPSTSAKIQQSRTFPFSLGGVVLLAIATVAAMLGAVNEILRLRGGTPSKPNSASMYPTIFPRRSFYYHHPRCFLLGEIHIDNLKMRFISEREGGKHQYIKAFERN
eukprot:UC4_evm1s658